MNTIIFDTYKFIKELEAAGVPHAQAEAMLKVQQEIIEHSIDELATKADLDKVEHSLKIEIQEVKFDLLKWIVGLALAQFALLVGILLKLPIH